MKLFKNLKRYNCLSVKKKERILSRMISLKINQLKKAKYTLKAEELV